MSDAVKTPETKPKLSIEALLQDRRAGATGAMPKGSVVVCLVAGLAAEVAALEEEQINIEAEARRAAAEAADRLGGPTEADADTEGISAEIEGLKERMAEYSISLDFEGLPGGKYRELQTQWPNSGYNEDRERWEGFLTALCRLCYKGATQDGEPVAVSFDDVWEALSYGEQDEIQGVVMTLNGNRVELPFSSKRSRRTRK